MRRSVRSAFEVVQAKKSGAGHEEDKQESKDKGLARKHVVVYPEGAAPLSRQGHPVGDKGHVPREKRSVRKLRENTNELVATSLLCLFFPPDPPYIGRGRALRLIKWITATR